MKTGKTSTTTLFVIIITGFLAACTAAPQPAPPTAAQISPTSTQTVIPKTATPTATPTPLPEPVAVKIGEIGKGTAINTAWSPNGNRLAVTSSRGLTIYSVPDWQEVDFFEFTPQSGIANEIVYEENGESILYVAGWETKTIGKINLLTGEMSILIEDIPGDYNDRFRLAPDGKTVVFYRNERPNLWGEQTSPPGFIIRDTNSEETLVSFFSEIDQSSPVNAVAYSPDSQWLASAGADNFVHVINVHTGAVRFKGSHDADVTTAAFHPDGNLLVSGGDDATLYFWDLKNGRKLYTLNGFTDEIDFVDFCLSGNALLVGFPDGVYQKWSLDDNHLPISQQPDSELDLGYELSLKISPDGKWLSEIDGGNFRIYNLDSWKKEIYFPKYTNYYGRLLLSVDGKYLVEGDGVSVWLTSTGEFLPFLFDHPEDISATNLHPKENILASARYDEIIEIWDLDQQKQVTTYQLPQGCHSHFLQYAPDGSLLAGISHNCGLCIWDTATGKLISQIEKPPETLFLPPIWFNKQQTEIYTSQDMRYTVGWDITTREKIFEGDLPDSLTSLVYDYHNYTNEASAILEGWAAAKNIDLAKYTTEELLNSDAPVTEDLIVKKLFNEEILEFYDLHSGDLITSMDLPQFGNAYNFQPDRGFLPLYPEQMVFSPNQHIMAYYDPYLNHITLYDISSIYFNTSASKNPRPDTPLTDPSIHLLPTQTPTKTPTVQNTPSISLPTPTETDKLTLSDFGTIDFGSIQDINWSPEGDFFAVIKGDYLTSFYSIVYQTDSLQPIQLIDHTDNPKLRVLSNRAEYLIDFYYSPPGYDLIVWSVETGEILYKTNQFTSSFIFDQDTSVLRDTVTRYVSEKDIYQFWEITLNLQTWEFTETLIGPGYFNYDDGIIYSPDKTFTIKQFQNPIQITDANTGMIRYSLERPADLGGYIFREIFTPKGDLLVWFQSIKPDADRSTTLEIWKVSLDTAPLLLWATTTSSMDVDERGRYNIETIPYAFSADGLFLAVQDRNGNINIHNGSTWQILKTISGGESVFFSPDSRSFLVIGHDDSISLWKISPQQSIYLVSDVPGFEHTTD